jgi:coenzyme PQQ precursor peptide PqqA
MLRHCFVIASSLLRHDAAFSFRSLVRPNLVPQETAMLWTTPVLVEICIGLEINGYLPAEF